MAVNRVKSIQSKSPSAEREALIFLHIPKTAGTTLHRIIARQFPKNATHNVYPLQVTSEGRNGMDEFKKLPDADRARIRYLRVHPGPFGLHEYLPQQCSYVTLLRDPVDRTMSLYFFLLRNPDLSRRLLGTDNISLQDFVKVGTNSNIQTRMISGVVAGFSTDTETPPSDILSVAKRNIQEHFALVGLAERFDELLVLLRRAFGWTNILYAKLNVASRSHRKYNIPKDTLRFIEQYNELDIDLYQWVKDEFERVVSEQGSSFNTEVHRFRVRNKVYQGINRPVSMLGHSLRLLRR